MKGWLCFVFFVFLFVLLYFLLLISCRFLRLGVTGQLRDGWIFSGGGNFFWEVMMGTGSRHTGYGLIEIDVLYRIFHFFNGIDTTFRPSHHSGPVECLLDGIELECPMRNSTY